MSSKSQDSVFNLDTFHARTQHTVRDPSPDVPANKRAETDFVALGAAFWDRREFDSRPNSLDLSEGEETPRDVVQMTERAELFSDADAVVAGDTLLRRSPATPTPTQPNYGPYIQPSDIAQVRERRDRKTGRGRRPHRGPGSHSSTGMAERDRRASDTSDDDGEDETDDLDDRGRSTTPTPYFSQSHTPSHHSQQTEEEHGEGRVPLSPDPWSSNFPYNAQQRERAEAIEGADTHFPAGQQPRAEQAYRKDVRSAREGSTS
ncbi:hypothetical protein P171DRAFT_434943 [Karstenula rhodostoma CBS 690.94]|uniref:Uncharacterized protein n=1 Tax=Karstenula rhodostoma CBS 690.94 TaxID=1392251 RepID=A0A9P4PCD7_9PLEO|nr:hypothetical protein P171DRAFT_434943 [Karstenula rhodostoma CBS 690.94]